MKFNYLNEDVIKTTKYAIENCYIGDLACMDDKSDIVVGNDNTMKVATINPECPGYVINAISKSDDIQTFAYVINMSKFHKLIKKSARMKDIYEYTSFSYIWNFIGKDVIRGIDDDTNNTKVIYIPRLCVNPVIVSLYTNDKKSEAFFNLLIIVTPDSVSDGKKNKKNKRESVNAVLKDMFTAAIYTKSKNILIDFESLNIDLELANSIFENIKKDTGLAKHINNIDFVVSPFLFTRNELSDTLKIFHF